MTLPGAKFTEAGFRHQLRRQLGYIDRSSREFDKGHYDEANRVAVALRTIFHHTRKSTSLLSHLGSPPIHMLSSTPDADEAFGPEAPEWVHDSQPLFYMGLVQVEMSVGGASFRAPLDDQALPPAPMPWAEWWQQTAWIIDGIRATRAELVLIAANKDGGAHVDEEVPGWYVRLSLGQLGFVSFGENSQRAAENLQAVSLRQIAWETLNSPELIALSA
jgi:hypothetical protein